MFLENSDVASESEIETKAAAASLGVHQQLEENNNDVSIDEHTEANSKHGICLRPKDTISREEVNTRKASYPSKLLSDNSTEFGLKSFNSLKRSQGQSNHSTNESLSMQRIVHLSSMSIVLKHFYGQFCLR